MKIQVGYRICLLLIFFMVHQGGRIEASQGSGKSSYATATGGWFKSWAPWFMGYANRKSIAAQPSRAPASNGWRSWWASWLPGQQKTIGTGTLGFKSVNVGHELPSSDPSVSVPVSTVDGGIPTKVAHVPEAPLLPSDRVRHDCVNKVIVPVIQQNAKFSWPKGNIPGTTLPWDKVAREESGNCGYHALNNALWVANALVRGTDLRFSDELQQRQYFQFMTIAFPIIARQRSAGQSTNWLGGGELELLLGQMKGSLIVPIIIIEHVQAVGLEFGEHVLRAVQVFVQDPRQLLGIIWNSGVRTSVDLMGGSHWVGMVAQHDGSQVKLYFMNSLTGINPNFTIIEKLLCNSAEQIQALIDQPKIDAMERDVVKMKQNLEMLSGTMGSNLFTKYIGCVEYSGPFLKQFTKEQIMELDVPAIQVDSVLASLNSNWAKHVQTKRAMALSFVAKRFYGVWMNPRTLDACAFDVSVKNCSESMAKYADSSLRVDGRNLLVVDSNTFFESMVNTCLVAWKDYGEWPTKIQHEISELLMAYLLIARDMPKMVQGAEWERFGGVRRAAQDILLKLPAVHIQGPKQWESLMAVIHRLQN